MTHKAKTYVQVRTQTRAPRLSPACTASRLFVDRQFVAVDHSQPKPCTVFRIRGPSLRFFDRAICGAENVVGRIESKIWHSGICRVAAALSKVKITLLCMSTHANHRVQAHRITSLTLRRAWKKNLNGYFLLFARTRGSFITTPRRGTRSRKESNRERSSAHTYQSLRRGTGQRVDWIVCASTPRQIKAVGVDSKIQDIFFGPSFATLTLALRSAVRPARLLREPSSVDYQAKRGVEHWMEQRGDKIKHTSRKRLA